MKKHTFFKTKLAKIAPFVIFEAVLGYESKKIKYHFFFFILYGLEIIKLFEIR